ncbi:MAG: extracellular solute-binding protein [Alphaproteobacteria bacterium]|nr:extracellular solute-binding protein [Alphaproteobacteria bacterium]
MKCFVTVAAAATCFVASAAIANAEDVVEVKYWTLKNQGLDEFVAQAKSSFEEANPGIRIIHEDFPNEAYKTAIQVALNGSEPPDAFFNWVGEDSARFVRDGLVLDISEFGTEENGFQSMLTEGWISSLRHGDGIYGVPMEAVSKFFYYNVDWFAEHDLSVPTSFNGLLQLCRDIRAIDADIVPMPLGNSERWKLNHFITMLNERVVGFEAAQDDYDLSASADDLFTDPKFVTAWEKVLELQQAGCFQDAPNATAPELTRAMFSSGTSPMIYCGSWCAGIFDQDGFTGYAMFRMPAVEGGDGADDTNFVLVQGYQVSAQTEHPEETVKWLNHLVSPKMAKAYAEIMSRVPSNPELLGESDALSEQFKWIANDVASVSTPINVLDVLLENSVSEAYLDAGVEVLNGTMTPQEAMDKIRETALQAKSNL